MINGQPATEIPCLAPGTRQSNQRDPRTVETEGGRRWGFAYIFPEFCETLEIPELPDSYFTMNAQVRGKLTIDCDQNE